MSAVCLHSSIYCNIILILQWISVRSWTRMQSAHLWRGRYIGAASNDNQSASSSRCRCELGACIFMTVARCVQPAGWLSQQPNDPPLSRPEAYIGGRCSQGVLMCVPVCPKSGADHEPLRAVRGLVSEWFGTSRIDLSLPGNFRNSKTSVAAFDW